MDALYTLLSKTPWVTWFIWAVVVVLVGLTGYSLYRLWHKTKRYIEAFEQVTKVLKLLMNQPEGSISPVDTKQVIEKFDVANSLLIAWEHFAVSLVSQSDYAGNIQIWRTSSANEAFSEDNLITEDLNKNFYLSWPGIITGIGLFTTFGMILLALLNLKVDTNQVVGMEELINGLSGKFLSSIAALLCATVFIFLEKRWFHELEKSRQKLVKTIDQLFPYLSQVQMLLNLQAELAKGADTFQNAVATEVVGLKDALTQETRDQKDALTRGMRDQVEGLQLFSVSLEQMLRSTFRESLTPTIKESLTPSIDRMAGAIDRVNRFLLESEKEKNAKFSDTINNLLKESHQILYSHLNPIISNIANEFRASLMTRTKEQFDKTDKLLSDTWDLFGSVHTQLVGTQDATHELVGYARTMTEGQLKVGQDQLRQLETVMQELMNGMKIQVQAFLADVTAQVDESSKQMGTQTAETTRNVLTQTKNWMTQKGNQIDKMLAAQEIEWNRIQKMRESLTVTTKQLEESMWSMSQLAEITQLAVETTKQTATILQHSNEQAQANLEQIVERNANQLATQLDELKEANSRQTAAWQGISASMREYQQVFRTVENKIGALLREVTGNLEKYQQVYADGFKTLNEVSEEHFANATRKLGASISDLDEHLHNLSEIFAKANGVQPNGNGIQQ